jgi:copper chaperone
MAIQKIILNVEGMSCEHCVNRIKKAVGALDGVSDVAVDLAGKKAEVEYDPALAGADAVKAAIEDAGYDVV